MGSFLDDNMAAMRESEQNEDNERKEKRRIEWLKVNQTKNERLRSLSQSGDYHNVLIDMDLYRNEDEPISNPSVEFPCSSNNKSNNNNSVITSPTKSQPRTISKPLRIGSSLQTPMSSLLLSASVSLHDNCSSHVGPDEFVELIRRKHDYYSPNLCRPGNRRRTVSENQASLTTKFPPSLRLKFITETKKTSKKDFSHHQQQQPITNDAINSQPIRKDSVCNYPIRKPGIEHALSSPTQSTSRSYHAPPSSLNTDDSMCNFPKFNVGSPTSPYSDLLHYGRSPSDHLILWKGANKRNKIIKLSNGEEESIEEGDEGQLNLETILETILRNHTAYDCMEAHARVIVLDLDLKVGSAFDAIAYDGIHATPLWDSLTKEYVGMLTMTDFIAILQQFIDQPDFLASMRSDPVRKWRDYLLSQSNTGTDKKSSCGGSGGGSSSVGGGGLTISSTNSLHQLATHLLEHKVHRVLVVDPVTQNPLYIASHRKILRYLWKKVNMNTPVNEVFSILLSQRLSGIPVVNDNFQVVDLLRKTDVMSLITDGSFGDLYRPVKHVLAYPRNGFEGLYSCKRSDSAYKVISAMVDLQLHRVLVLDREGRLEGVITVSDVMDLLLRVDDVVDEMEDSD